MSADSNVAPVIIKRKKVVSGGGHHGGAWKVAYADFVTAMMAFFMLMWLLNATTEKQRKGIADHFTPTVAIARVSGGGDGVLGGETPSSAEQMAQIGMGGLETRRRDLTSDLGRPSESGEAEALSEAAVAELEERLRGFTGESEAEDDLMRHVVTETTDEGLVISLRDTAERTLFTEDGAPTPLVLDLADMIAGALAPIGNDLAIEGHVMTFPLVLAEDPAWRLSSQRAEAFRNLLGASGLDPERVARVTAHADREPALRNLMDPGNNRLDVIVLTK